MRLSFKAQGTAKVFVTESSLSAVLWLKIVKKMNTPADLLSLWIR